MAEEAHEKKEAAPTAAHGNGGGDHGGGGGGGGHGGGGHGGGGGHEEAHEGAPEWLISFADNVALLMGFFVILLAMNMGPKHEPTQGGVKGEKGGGFQTSPAMEAIIGIREAFHTRFNPNNADDAAVIEYMRKKANAGRAEDPGIPGNRPEVQSLPRGNYNSVTGVVVFDDKSALLSPSARTVVTDVAAHQRDQRWVLEVRGHVSPFECMRDNVKAMQLSNERALAVALALVEAGLSWENLRVVSCGANDRVVARTFDPTEDRSNQRVEIVVTNDTVQADPYAQDGGAKNPEPPTAGAPEEKTGPESK
jgi:flagellar motor protein MotB